MPRATSAKSRIWPLSQRLEFCNWLNRPLHHYVLCTDERNSIAIVSIIKLPCVVTRQFSRPCKSKFQIRVTVNVGCAALHNQATCSFVFKSHLTYNACLRFPQKEFFPTWRMCPPINEIVYASSVNQRILVCLWPLSISLAIISLDYGSEVVFPKIDHPGLET
jgi:hypothetical protein